MLCMAEKTQMGQDYGDEDTLELCKCTAATYAMVNVLSFQFLVKYLYKYLEMVSEAFPNAPNHLQTTSALFMLSVNYNFGAVLAIVLESYLEAKKSSSPEKFSSCAYM